MRIRLALILLSVLGTVSATAQPTLTPRNLALGGGGAAYLTGPSATFYNPANLLIQDRTRRVQTVFGSSAVYFEPVITFEGYNDQLNNFRRHFEAFNSFTTITDNSFRADLVDRLYPTSSRTSSEHISLFEINWFGINWKNGRTSFAIAARTRGANRFEVGRNWYDSNAIERSSDFIFDQSVNQRFQVFHEISFGYAESFELLNGLSPNLDKFSIGIAPKFIVSGAHLNTNYQSRFIKDDLNGATGQHITQFSYNSTGAFSDATQEFLLTSNSRSSIQNAFASDWINTITGFGAGIDVGITYLVTFGNDLSTLEGSTEPTKKSLRLSFSITDIGLIRYTENPLALAIASDTTQAAPFDPVSNVVFEGSPGSFLTFLDTNGQADVFRNGTREDQSFSNLLPMALHGGVLLEINRLKLTGDLNLGLTNNAFNTKQLLSHFGIELRPLNFLPLRAGTRLALNRPTLFSFGTAIESRRFELSVAAQLTNRDISDRILSGAAVTALSFNF